MVEAKEKTTKKEAANKSTPKVDDFAVIKTGGKQYVVYPGKLYDFEKLEAEEGKDIIFDKVLLSSKGKDLKIGQPLVAGAKVVGKVQSQFKDKKITVLKYKPKKRYRKKTGHRQEKTRVEIVAID